MRHRKYSRKKAGGQKLYHTSELHKLAAEQARTVRLLKSISKHIADLQKQQQA